MIHILHISDLHFINNDSYNNAAEILLQEASEKVKNVPQGEKLLIVTGDFHNFLDIDYQKAAAFMHRLVSKMGLDIKHDVFVIPGNHDEGNDTTLKPLLEPEDKDWKLHQESCLEMLKEGERGYIEERLRKFRPYSAFVQRLGIYDTSWGEDYPASSHVRCWRNKLNILHLNTALVADRSRYKDKQMTDVEKAANPLTWRPYYESIPSIAIGHCNFHDLIINQQHDLATTFYLRNVSAYLYGQQGEQNPEYRSILLNTDMKQRISIPNLSAVKSLAEGMDKFSEVGFCWHYWDEASDTVSVEFRKWKGYVSGKTDQDGEGCRYEMRHKKADRRDIDFSVININWEGFMRIHGGEVGARDMFEKAMDALLRAENPGKEVHIVKASRGDGGIDVYVHQEDGIDIYQCKFFMGSMTAGRWEQIRESFDSAMKPKGVKVLRWVLCMPREMQKEDIEKWHEFKVKRASYGLGDIQVVDGNEIVEKMRECDQSLGTDLIERFFGITGGVHVVPKCLTEYVPVGPTIGLVGRDKIVDDLRAMLDAEKCVALVRGLGGIGKTAVMQKVCDKIQTDGNDENHVAWITCGESLEDDLLTLRDALGVPKGAGREEAYAAVVQALKTFPGTLYLFMDDMKRIPDDMELGTLNALRPKVRIMITSRRVMSGIPHVELKNLEEDSVVDMFYGYYGRDKDRRYVTDARLITDSEAVRRHTLLVELVAKAARRSFDTLDVFRKELEKKGFFAVKGGRLDGNRTIEDSVKRLYDISGLTDEQKRIMSLFTIFTPEKVIYGKVVEWAGFDGNDVEELVKLGWLGRAESGYVIHQIVRDSIARQVGDSLRIEEYGELLEKASDTASYISENLEYTKVWNRLIFAEDVARYVDIRVGKLPEDNNHSDSDVMFLESGITLLNNVGAVYGSQGENKKAQEYYEKAQLAQRYLNQILSKEINLDTFFQKYYDKLPHFTDLQQFFVKENIDVLQSFPNTGLSDLFRFATANGKERMPNNVKELLELLWKLYLVDSDRVKLVNVSEVKDEKNEREEVEEKGEINDIPQETQANLTEYDDTVGNHKPDWRDLEKATELVLNDFEVWWKNEAKSLGQRFLTNKPTTRQRHGVQYGYDVGQTTTFGERQYRLRFECKDYTSNISSGKQDEANVLRVNNYAYNLLEFYMYCSSEVNNRWVLVCPFGNLQNDFPENLFEHWNNDHPFMKIYAIMEKSSPLSCKDFFSINKEAYSLVYQSTYNGEKTRETVFKDLYKMIIGADDVVNNTLIRLKKYEFWKKYGGHDVLLPVPSGEKQVAIEQILCFLREKKEKPNDTQKRTLFIIGEYGTGKSWLCFQVIEQIAYHPSEYPFIPFYIQLKELSNNEKLAKSKQYRSIIDDTLSEYYAGYDKWAGDCVEKKFTPLFILDGFDEVFSGLSATDKKIAFLVRIIDALKDWYIKRENERAKNTHIKPIFVITSRESDFEIGMKSKEFQQQMEQAETVKLELCSPEKVWKEFKRRVINDVDDESWFKQFEQNLTFLEIIRRPVFFGLCVDAFKREEFRRKAAAKSMDEVDVLDTLFDDELENYAKVEGINQEDLQNEIYRCAEECTREKNSQVIFKGKNINQVIHVGMVKIQRDQFNDGTCWVSFEHNIVREYLTAKYLGQCLFNSSDEEKENPMESTFLQKLQKLSLTPEAIKLLLLCIEKESPWDNGECYKQLLKEWLCNNKVKSCVSRLPARLLEILLQPGQELCGESGKRLDLSGLNASDLCLWNCGIRHVNLSKAVLRNWQLINLELDDVDLRGADMNGLKLAPDKPISSICHWKDIQGWHVASLHENGQIMQYSFQDNSWERYSANVLAKTEVNEGMFHFGNELLLYSVNRLYDEKENELYHIRSNKKLQRIMTASDFCGYITNQNGSCQAIVFHGEMAPVGFMFNMNWSGRLCLTDRGQVLYVQDDAINLIDHTGKMRRLCEWENDYESFTVRLEPVGENHIYIKCGEHLIHISLDEEMNGIISPHKELRIQGEIETTREVRALNENTLVAVGKNELFILSLEKNNEVEEVKSMRLKTAIIIKNSLLEDESGENRVQDENAYELLCTSMC